LHQNQRRAANISLMTAYVGSLDQGTTSTRFMILDESGSIVAVDQMEHDQILPQPGWVEHDAAEIWANTRTVISGSLDKAELAPTDLVSVGLTNQRETTVLWDRRTGEPVSNAIVWQDMRTADLVESLGGEEGPTRYQRQTGLPLATYFAGPKVRWLLDELDLRDQAERGDLAFGTIDSWIAWNLTGGSHITDVTNASRTMLMDIATLTWDADIALEMGIPTALLPDIVPSVGDLGTCVDPLEGVPLTAILGDQHAALFGQACFGPGEAKNTYGTGNFMLMNTGTQLKHSSAGLLTTVGYQVDGSEAIYALEGSVAVSGSLIQWLRDNLGLIDSTGDVETLANSVDDNGGAYFVPAFSGLFAPYWRPDARGVITGLTRFVNRGHIARAALEATAFQTLDVLNAMTKDSGVALSELRVDGGMTVNSLLMQFQADILGVDVVRPSITETTALGSAFGAGLAVGVWSDLDEIAALWAEDQRWHPSMEEADRQARTSSWHKAVDRSLDWV
jgi:glycerol kinase